MSKIRDLEQTVFRSITSAGDIDLRRLSNIDCEKDTVLSVYFRSRIDADKQFTDQRLKIMKKALPEALAESLDETVSLAKEALHSEPSKGERGRAIFASSPDSILEAYRLGIEVGPAVILDSSPFLLPIAKLRREYHDYCLLLIDSREAEIFIVRSDLVEKKSELSTDLMNKHKKGGMSQMRFNRLRRGAIKSFLSEVIEDLREIEKTPGIKGLVVAGPGEAKDQIMEMLPQSLKAMIIGEADVSMGVQVKDLARAGDDIAARKETSREKEASERLKDAILKGLPAAYGPEEVRSALKEGRVNLLMLLSDFPIPGMVCKSCRIIPETNHNTCPSCGGNASIENVAEELYQMAQRTGAEVLLVKDDPFLKSIGGIGANLRY